MHKKILFGLLALALVAPSAAAVTVGVGDDPTTDENESTHYVAVDEGSGAASVWEESNGCEGLQQVAGDCDGDGTDEESDTRIA